jgi:hypothetical protein
VTTRQRNVRPPEVQTPLGRAAVQIFAVNERMNQMVVEHLDPAAWRAKPPGKVRSIVAIFTHMHNMRCKWLRLTAPHLKVPKQLDRAHCTPRQARAGLAESAARCREMLAEAFGGGGRHVEKFLRDGWAKPWPVGVEMLCYMLSHEAHHQRLWIQARYADPQLVLEIASGTPPDDPHSSHSFSQFQIPAVTLLGNGNPS